MAARPEPRCRSQKGAQGPQMSFDAAEYLRRATSRAKSDVANKMVSMFLHEISRRISLEIKLSVTDGAYCDSVKDVFGNQCCYCAQPLERDRASVEHLDGMNRFQVGLHIPGNVMVACKRCNGEKRRDDQIHEHTIAPSAWESFLSHDSTRCDLLCKTCSYWATVWPDQSQRVTEMKSSRQRLVAFRESYAAPLLWARKAKPFLKQSMNLLYRDCQRFAAEKVAESVSNIFREVDAR